MNTQQDVTVNKQKTQNKASQTWDDAMRASNDPDAVADSGSGSGGNEA
jgi:phage terminase large subunit-like protein